MKKAAKIRGNYSANVSSKVTTVINVSKQYSNESMTTLSPIIAHPCVNSSKLCEKCLTFNNDTL